MAERYAGFHHKGVRASRLLHQKKHRMERRCFLVEGPLLFEAAVAAGARIESVFVLRSDLGDAELALLGQTSATVYEVDRRTLKQLSQTKAPQGIVAVVGFVDRSVDQLARILPASGPAVVAVLPNLSDPGNAGTLIRSAEAFGAAAVCFGPHSVEPYNDKVVRASMGSLFRVPIVRYETWNYFVSAARSANLMLVGSRVGGEDVRNVTLAERVALLIGQERHGLADIPPDDLQAVAAIPQAPGVESLNAGVAGSILLYELARARGLVSAWNK